MPPKKTTSNGNSSAGNGGGSNGKNVISWRTSPRIVQPKRSDFNLNLDIKVSDQLNKFESYLREDLREDLDTSDSLKSGIIEEILIKAFKEDVGFQNWLKASDKKREDETNNNSQSKSKTDLDEEEDKVLNNIGNKSGQKAGTPATV